MGHGQPQELHEFRKEYLRLIVIMEARAKPRLQGCMTAEELQADHQLRHQLWERKITMLKGAATKKLLDQEPTMKMPGSGCAGLWRKATATRPAMMTDYIRSHKLLPSQEIDSLQQNAPTRITQDQADFAAGLDIVNWHDFLEMFTDEDAIDEISFCSGCHHK